jgi:hypothetical protein
VLRLGSRSISACAFMCVMGSADVASAIDPFEIQVYDADLNPVGAGGIELHSNYVFSGQETGTPPELPRHHVLHETLEPSYGLASFMELGAYLQTALQPGGPYEYAGVKLRSKFALPEIALPQTAPLRFAVNVEISYLPSRYDHARWGSEIRPIVEWKPGIFTIAINPIISFDWTGDGAGIPHFEPCAAVRVELFKLVELGLEYYAGFGRFDRILPAGEQEQFLFETVNVIAFERYEIQVGIGEGLSSASSGVVGKMILGHQF